MSEPTCSRVATDLCRSSSALAARRRCARSTACRSRCAAGEALGLVGESGSGKTMTLRAILGLLPRDGADRRAGAIEIDGEDLAARRAASRCRELRGRTVVDDLPGADDAR